MLGLVGQGGYNRTDRNVSSPLVDLERRLHAGIVVDSLFYEDRTVRIERFIVPKKFSVTNGVKIDIAGEKYFCFGMKYVVDHHNNEETDPSEDMSS